MEASLELELSWNSSWTDLNHPRKHSQLWGQWLLAAGSYLYSIYEQGCALLFSTKNQTLICQISFVIELHLFSWPTLLRRKREPLTEFYWDKVWISLEASLHRLPFISSFGLLYYKWKFMKRSHVRKHQLTKLYWHGKVGMLQDQSQLSYSLLTLASWMVMPCSLLCQD